MDGDFLPSTFDPLGFKVQPLPGIPASVFLHISFGYNVRSQSNFAAVRKLKNSGIAWIRRMAHLNCYRTENEYAAQCEVKRTGSTPAQEMYGRYGEH